MPTTTPYAPRWSSLDLFDSKTLDDYATLHFGLNRRPSESDDALRARLRTALDEHHAIRVSSPSPKTLTVSFRTMVRLEPPPEPELSLWDHLLMEAS